MDFRVALLSGTAPTFPVGEFGLRGKKEVAVTPTHCGMLVSRKSRYLRKDAQGFLDLKAAIEKQRGQPLAGLVLLRVAPLCSKAKALLEENGVRIERLED